MEEKAMKEELLKIAQESLSSDEVSEIVKEKFMNAVGDAIENAFRWGNVKKTIEEKVEEVMIPILRDMISQSIFLNWILF